MPSSKLPRRDFLGRLVAGLAGGAWVAATKGASPARARSVQVVTPFVGEIRLWPGTFEPSGWMFCDGRLLDIAQYETLFYLIGTTYGGDGQFTYGLPDLRGRAPVHVGTGYTLGEMGGEEQTTLLETQLPSHSHVARAGSAAGTSDSPVGLVPARNAAGVFQYNSIAHTTLSSTSTQPVGGGQAHPNMQPYVGIHFIISLFGIYPSPG